MLPYKDFLPSQRSFISDAIVLFAFLANVFVALFAASYGVAVWRDIKFLLRQDALSIMVSGEGKVAAIPDIARFTAAVITEDASLATAQAENTRRSQAVVSYLTSNGVLERDIQTTDFAVHPQYVYPRPCTTNLCPPEAAPRIIGYRVRNEVAVRVRDLAKAGDLVGGVVGAGANEVGSISFTIDEPSQLQAEARGKAIEDARAKAERLAADLGRHVGSMVSFSEGGYPGPVYFDKGLAAGFGGDEAPRAAPPIQPGEREVTVSVSVVYLFE